MRTPGRRAVLEVVAIVVALAAVGAVAGIVWEWLWTAPRGVVIDHRWVPGDEAGLRSEFSGTGWYVVIGTVAGLILGAVVALVADRRPLGTLAGIVVGTVLGAWLMRVVGVALGPADPHALARSAADGTHLPDMLEVSGASPYVAYPTGALVGLALVFLGLSAMHRRDDGV